MLLVGIKVILPLLLVKRSAQASLGGVAAFTSLRDRIFRQRTIRMPALVYAAWSASSLHAASCGSQRIPAGGCIAAVWWPSAPFRAGGFFQG
jgi:hypothetical protein